MTLRRLFCRIWRVLRWLVLALVLLALALIAALWWANRHDEPLRPEVAEALRFEAPAPEAMRRNGYFIMLGLGAPAQDDAFAAGQRFFAVQMRQYEAYRNAGTFDPDTQERADAGQTIRWGDERCGPDVGDCYAHYLQRADQIRALLAQHEAPMRRYLAALETPVYEEVIPPSIVVQLPSYPNVFAVSDLLVMRAALLMHDRQTSEALALLEKNAHMHQRLMSGAGGLVGLGIALNMDLRQQRLIAGILRARPALSGDELERLRALIEIPRAATLERAFRGEGQMQLDIFDRIAREMARENAGLAQRAEVFAMKFVFLPNETLNRLYLGLRETHRLARVTPDRVDAQAAQAIKTYRAVSELDSPIWLRNHEGRMTLNLTGPDSWLTWIKRFHDIEGHRRLVLLQIAALRDHVPFDQMPAWLAQQPPGLRNPYTLQPMGWDAAAQSLVFEGRQKNNQNPEPKNIYRVRLADEGAR
jgi:hypothetical protein